MNSQVHKITTKQAEKILFETYTIVGKASLLPGEIDTNFKIQIDGKDTYILKISHNSI